MQEMLYSSFNILQRGRIANIVVESLKERRKIKKKKWTKYGIKMQVATKII